MTNYMAVTCRRTHTHTYKALLFLTLSVSQLLCFVNISSFQVPSIYTHKRTWRHISHIYSYDPLGRVVRRDNSCSEKINECGSR